MAISTTDFNGTTHLKMGGTGTTTKRPRRPWPQPPWVDVGERVRIRQSGRPGLVISAELLLVGWVYEVLHQDGITSFARDHLDFEREP